jgi:excisionase family DNA binding protein
MVPHDADSSESDLPGLDELISLREAAKLSGLSAGHLRLLVRRGELWGVKLGRNWVTTAKAVEEYLAQDHRPGPKPKKPRDQPKFLRYRLDIASDIEYNSGKLLDRFYSCETTDSYTYTRRWRPSNLSRVGGEVMSGGSGT